MVIAFAFAVPGYENIYAGPPFVTDDPEPVAYHHWEVYVGSQLLRNAFGLQGTVPHVEVNFGVLPETQLHIIMPFELSQENQGTTSMGLGDVELGVKLRFVKESSGFPQVGAFPHVLLPTGDTATRLGTGRVQVFAPLWLQKTMGGFTAYGGGGFWASPAHAAFDYWSFGGVLQYAIAAAVSAGAELFHNTAAPTSGQAETGCNAGTVINMNSMHHILLSVGTDIRGPNNFMMYAAYQLTL